MTESSQEIHQSSKNKKVILKTIIIILFLMQGKDLILEIRDFNSVKSF